MKFIVILSFHSCHDHLLVAMLNFFWAIKLYRMSQEECARLRKGVPYVKVHRYNPKHLCLKIMEIMAREKCGLLVGPHTVPVS